MENFIRKAKAFIVGCSHKKDDWEDANPSKKSETIHNYYKNGKIFYTRTEICSDTICKNCGHEIYLSFENYSWRVTRSTFFTLSECMGGVIKLLLGIFIAFALGYIVLGFVLDNFLIPFYKGPLNHEIIKNCKH